MLHTRTRTTQIDWDDTRLLSKIARRSKHVRIIRTDGKENRQGRLTRIEVTGPTTRRLHLDTPDGPIHAAVTTTGYQLRLVA